jgi:hypothetical protein
VPARDAGGQRALLRDLPVQRSISGVVLGATRCLGITAYLKNGGALEKAAAMANHASMRTTQLYDRRRDEVSLDEVERIVI